MNKSPIFAAFLIVFALFLIGCQSLGLSQPQSFDQKLAYSYGVHTAVVQAATVALDHYTLSSSDGLQVQNLANESRVLLDAARAAEVAGDPTTASGKLALATTILVQLQTFLQTRGAK